MISFAPELQEPWALEEILLARCDQVLVRVSSGLRYERPSVMGRHGTDIMSYPEISSVRCEAEFTFSDCLLFLMAALFADSPNHLF